MSNKLEGVKKPEEDDKYVTIYFEHDPKEGTEVGMDKAARAIVRHIRQEKKEDLCN